MRGDPQYARYRELDVLFWQEAVDLTRKTIMTVEQVLEYEKLRARLCTGWWATGRQSSVTAALNAIAAKAAADVRALRNVS